MLRGHHSPGCRRDASFGGSSRLAAQQCSPLESCHFSTRFLLLRSVVGIECLGSDVGLIWFDHIAISLYRILLHCVLGVERGARWRGENWHETWPASSHFTINKLKIINNELIKLQLEIQSVPNPSDLSICMDSLCHETPVLPAASWA